MTKIWPNMRGLLETLGTDDAQRAVDEFAEEIADKARANATLVEGIPGDIPMPIEVSSYKAEGRARATVWLAHPAGLADQAKNGSLTRAASQAGAEVHS